MSMPELNHVAKQEDLKKELLVKTLENCYYAMEHNERYKLDDEAKTFAILQLDPNPLGVEENYLTYYGKTLKRFGGSSDGFENRGEQEIRKEILLLGRLEAKVSGLQLLYAIANVKPDLISDQIILRMFAFQKQRAAQYTTTKGPWYFSDEKKIEIFNAIPKEQQKIFLFSKELEELANESTKSPDPETSEPEEDLRDTPDFII